MTSKNVDVQPITVNEDLSSINEKLDDLKELGSNLNSFETKITALLDSIKSADNPQLTDLEDIITENNNYVVEKIKNLNDQVQSLPREGNGASSTFNLSDSCKGNSQQ